LAMKCPKCGSNNREDDLYCAKCGTELKARKDLATDDRTVFPCPYCGTENYDTATECKSCHREIHSPFVYCPVCGTRNLASDRVCRNCEFPLPVRIKPESPQGTLPLPDSLSCPSCGNQMEKGFVIGPNDDSFRRVRWSTYESPLWLYPGEPVRLGDLVVSNLNIPAFRCPACKLVVMRY
jgi:predicted RNA-binding Zn-ribbon protein involved in translation (DUF1610 family)